MISRDRIPDFISLMRLDRPIGIWLLLWPTLIALWIAGDGHPAPEIVVIFVAGVVLMRSAGCVINDYADRHIDGQVWRTADRPLASGRILGGEALLLFALLIALSAGLLLFLPIAVFYWSFGALALAVLYPFMKRVTYLPQVVLGAAFSWAIPMAFVAQGREPNDLCWLLYAGNLAWTVAYDTQYAMADREDDIKAGVKSTAILFGDLDRTAIVGLQLFWLTALALLGYQMQWPWPWWTGLGTVAVLFIWQWQHIASRNKHFCLTAFRHNHWVGLVLFVALLMAWLQQLAPHSMLP